MRIFAVPFGTEGNSSLKILKDKYKQVPKLFIKIFENVNSISVRSGLREIKEYTKKSLILAQDER